MKRIVAFVGDYYHPEELAKDALNQALKPMIDAGELLLEYKGVEQLNAALAEKPDVVILFGENRLKPTEDEAVRWMTAEIADEIAAYVQSGGGWVAWHSGLASYDPKGSYVSMLRGYFLHHPEKHQLVTYSEEGKSPFEIIDEHYFVSCQEEHTDVFLRSNSIDGSSIAGWRHSFGAGRVCCITPAHRREGLLHPEVLALLAQSVEYSSESN